MQSTKDNLTGLVDTLTLVTGNNITNANIPNNFANPSAKKTVEFSFTKIKTLDETTMKANRPMTLVEMDNYDNQYLCCKSSLSVSTIIVVYAASR